MLIPVLACMLTIGWVMQFPWPRYHDYLLALPSAAAYTLHGLYYGIVLSSAFLCCHAARNIAARVLPRRLKKKAPRRARPRSR